MTTLTERLETGKLLIMDGGVSTEIQRRGIPLDPNVWSGLTTKTNPDDVRAIHEEYIRAGAEIITANTFSTARHVLESIMLGHEARLLNRKSVLLAQQARDNCATGNVWIAGSMSSMPPLTRNYRAVINDNARSSYLEQAEVLAESGVDLIVCEMMRDRENAEIVISAALSTGLPVWVGYSIMVDKSGDDVKGLRWLDGKQTDVTHDFSAMLESLAPLGGQVAGIMHTEVGDVDKALEELGRHWQGPRMVYAETGRLVPPDWDFDETVSPAEYLGTARAWVDRHGVQIIGGCCGTGPDHIRELNELLS